MLFTSKKYITWDTWVYYYNKTYYAYYLITDKSPGEGFGVATSTDGIHFIDHGMCISASSDMVFYLGTGAVWRSPNFDEDKTFLCNYSEWRKEDKGNVQNIFFAKSKDLIHWDKIEDKIFKIDEEMYVKYELEGGRWDCIYPLVENDKYYGLFTATPKDYLGCGFAESFDGINWVAKNPPEFDLTNTDIKVGIELGAICKHNDIYYILMGTYVNKYGIAVLKCRDINGKYEPQAKNFGLLSNNSFRHAYFMRFFEKDGELLVNHHVISRHENEDFRPDTSLAPFKKVVFDSENNLRLLWFDGNDKLFGKLRGNSDYTKFSAKGHILDGITILEENGNSLQILSDNITGNVKIYYAGNLVEDIYKDIQFNNGSFKILKHGEYLELYIDDNFITCYTLESEIKNIHCKDITYYTLNI